MTKKVSLAVLVLFVAGVIYAALYVRNHGFSARAEPAWYEKWLAGHARRIATPAGAKELKNPNAITDAGMSEAREHFVEHCSTCHGIDGRGKTVFGRNMYPKVPDMTDSQTQELTDGELFYIINNGVRFTGMPAFGSEDSPESIWDLVAFIRRLPQLSPEELKQLQTLAGEEMGQEAEEADGQKGEAKAHEEKAKPAPSKPKKTKPHTHEHGDHAHSD
ncbi:MAG TPA: c-type cytochrome [Blastocatellia bacterium]|nr:c-type cytochrome [Blastocatellia bacterium]